MLINMCDVGDNPCDSDQVCNLDTYECQELDPFEDVLYVQIEGQTYAGSQVAITRAIENKYATLFDPRCTSVGEQLTLSGDSMSLIKLEQTEGKEIISFVDMNTQETFCEAREELLNYWSDLSFRGYLVMGNEEPTDDSPEISAKNFMAWIWSDKFISDEQVTMIRNSPNYVFMIAPTQYQFVSVNEVRGPLYFAVPVGYLKEGRRRVRKEVPNIPLISPLWDIVREMKGKLEKSIKTPGRQNRSIAFNSSGTHIASGDSKGITVWDIEKKSIVLNETIAMRERERVNNLVSFHPVIPNLLVSASDRIYIWDIFENEPINIIQTESVWALHVGMDRIYTGVVRRSYDVRDRHILIWDLETGELVERIDGVWGVRELMAVSPDETLIAYFTTRSQLVLRSIPIREAIIYERAHIRSHVEGITFSVNNILAVFLKNGHTDLFDEQLHPLRSLRARGPEEIIGRFSPTGEILVTVFNYGEKVVVYVWSMEDYSQLSKKKTEQNKSNALAFNPSRRAQLALAGNNKIHFWDLSVLIN